VDLRAGRSGPAVTRERTHRNGDASHRDGDRREHPDVFRLLEFCRQSPLAMRSRCWLLEHIRRRSARPWQDPMSSRLRCTVATRGRSRSSWRRTCVRRVHRPRPHLRGRTRILDDMVATGCQVLELDHKSALEPAKRAARGRACLLGNVDTTLLMSGTPGDVDDACREVIDAWQPDGGFILALAARSGRSRQPRTCTRSSMPPPGTEVRMTLQHCRPVESVLAVSTFQAVW